MEFMPPQWVLPHECERSLADIADGGIFGFLRHSIEKCKLGFKVRLYAPMKLQGLPHREKLEELLLRGFEFVAFRKSSQAQFRGINHIPKNHGGFTGRSTKKQAVLDENTWRYVVSHDANFGMRLIRLVEQSHPGSKRRRTNRAHTRLACPEQK